MTKIIANQVFLRDVPLIEQEYMIEWAIGITQAIGAIQYLKIELPKERTNSTLGSGFLKFRNVDDHQKACDRLNLKWVECPTIRVLAQFKPSIDVLDEYQNVMCPVPFTCIQLGIKSRIIWEIKVDLSKWAEERVLVRHRLDSIDSGNSIDESSEDDYPLLRQLIIPDDLVITELNESKF